MKGWSCVVGFHAIVVLFTVDMPKPPAYQEDFSIKCSGTLFLALDCISSRDEAMDQIADMQNQNCQAPPQPLTTFPARIPPDWEAISRIAPKIELDAFKMQLCPAGSKGQAIEIAEVAKASPRGAGNRRKKKLPARSGA